MQKKSLLVLISVFAALTFYSCKPEITSFTPKNGVEGTEVTVYGKNFKADLDGNTVKIGDIRVQDVVTASEDLITLKIPSDAQTGKISVKTNWGTGYSAENFVVDSGPKGYALAIGLNAVDPGHYGGWDGELTGCEPDARDMTSIAENEEFSVDTLLTANATRQTVLSKLSNLSENLNSGDLLVVSYSGHGGQVPDRNDDEDDQEDETWCLYDGQLLDDELYHAWSKFRKGVRIIVFSDSCHSGTVLRMINTDYETPPRARIDELEGNLKAAKSLTPLRREGIRSLMKDNAVFRNKIRELSPGVKPVMRDQEVSKREVDVVFSTSKIRVVPFHVLMNTYNNNRQFYDDIGTAAPKEDPSAVNASLILISACQDDQGAWDVGTNGAFTLMLKQVWDNGGFSGTHVQFHIGIRALVMGMYNNQDPNFYLTGTQDDAFVQQRPYTIR
jgi:hypothetical protein